MLSQQAKFTPAWTTRLMLVGAERAPSDFNDIQLQQAVARVISHPAQ
ncbi:hypothetical protein KR50_05460 [Jeotgalibacillus campisalis]|uniref:Uncharacterized protein n=1 Tax=Jeotgalibacillus campisalis TaxID=220754 RepID=A0A0C2VUN5_9BACL|nr:hypothetical protein KR50_05460 [Jeotgalibacillus campisalis]